MCVCVEIKVYKNNIGISNPTDHFQSRFLESGILKHTNKYDYKSLSNPICLRWVHFYYYAAPKVVYPKQHPLTVAFISAIS